MVRSNNKFFPPYSTSRAENAESPPENHEHEQPRNLTDFNVDCRHWTDDNAVMMRAADAEELIEIDESQNESNDVNSRNSSLMESSEYLSDVDEHTNCEGQSKVSCSLRETSDEVLTLLASGCMARSTNADMMRFLSVQTPSIRKEVMSFYKCDDTSFNCHYFCNGCGKQLVVTETCCSSKMKYIRIGAFEQLTDVLNEHFHAVLEIREALRKSKTNHNLKGDYLRRLWQSEGQGRLNLSLIGSVDGVSLSGNTKKKLWPITFMLVDIPTMECQKAANISLQGLVEGDVDPSTIFWNAIIDQVFVDIENRVVEKEGYSCQFSIVSFTADQPAKRSLFGMKACNSEGSCFFGLCTGTVYKKMGKPRYKERIGSLTDEDAQNQTNGFGGVVPKIVNYIYPYDTVVDLLHNASEGLIPIIISETFTSDDAKRRSTLFSNDLRTHKRLSKEVIVNSRFVPHRTYSASEKITYFRISFGLAAFQNNSLQPVARLVIISLMLLLNAMYSDASTDDLFYVHLTAVVRWGLETSSTTYLATKCHELVCHLPFVVQQFGNPAPLSTFCFEHFYKFSLKGFNPQLTKMFSEFAVSRLLLHIGVRREISHRIRNKPSHTLFNFLRATPQMQEFQYKWNSPIKQLLPEDVIDEQHHFSFFSTANLPVGRMVSRYNNDLTQSDHFFATSPTGYHQCFRFISIRVKNDESADILAEHIENVPLSDRFADFKRIAWELDHPGSAYAFNMVTQMERYAGIVHGQPSGRRVVLPLTAVKGAAAILRQGQYGYYIQVNGATVHH